MKTTTKAKPATAPRALKVEPFTVTTEWVSVTTTILAKHAERMQRVPFYQKAPRLFCGQLVKSFHTDNLIHGTRRHEIKFLAYGFLTGRKTCPVTFNIEAARWAEITRLCSSINTTPTAFIRAAIAHAALGWARFDLNQNRDA